MKQYVLPSNLAAIVIEEDNEERDAFVCRIPADRDQMIAALEEALFILAEMTERKEDCHGTIH